jgi:chemotaxis protein MotB
MGIADYFQNPLKVALQGGAGSGDSSSLIQGGGNDLSAAHGQVKRGDIEAPKKTINLQKLKAEFEKAERAKLSGLKDEMDTLIDGNPALKQFKSQMLLDLTSEGLRIQIVDEKNRPMFDSASSEVKPYTRVILREIGKMLNKVENHVSLSGHTDAQPFAGGARDFSNWELSTNRANASRRELVAGGMHDAKVMRTVGLASTVLYDKQDPYNPINRRISIVIMNKRTEDAILADGKEVEVEGAEELEAAVRPAAGAAAR